MTASRMRWMGVLCAAVVVTRASPSWSQEPAPAAPASSTLAGVYTAGQAERGRITYAGMCRSCHSAASHTGAMFEKWWKGRTVADLFAYASSQMPKNNPGSMNPDEYADVVAYLLKMNAMPAGVRELAADSASLATVLIEMPPAPPKRAAGGRSKPPRKPSGTPTRTQED